MNIYTSYYGNMRKLKKDGIVPVAISAGIPKYFNGDSLSYLAPRGNMLHMTEERYTPEYMKILEKVDINRLREDIKIISTINGGKDVALLCYERSGDFCHRRLFAKWLEEKTGYKVKEYGFDDEPVKRIEVSQGTLF